MAKSTNSPSPAKKSPALVKSKGSESKTADLQKIPVPQLMEQLASSKDGLSGEEAKNRIEKYGYNELPEKAVNPFLKFLSYFWGPIPLMIAIAAILSAVLRHWPYLDVSSPRAGSVG